MLSKGLQCERRCDSVDGVGGLALVIEAIGGMVCRL